MTGRLSGMRPGDEIAVTRGVLWITQQGDPADYLVREGQKYTAAAHGPVAVQALQSTACYIPQKGR